MTSYVDATSGAVEHCETMAKLHPDLAESFYDKIAKYCRDKLWHQLTLTALDFFSQMPKTLRTTSEGTNSYLALYDKVILCVDTKLNPLRLVEMASAVANSLVSSEEEAAAKRDATAAKAILENLLEKKDALGKPAAIYLESKLALLTLNTTAAADQLSESTLTSIKSTIASNAAVLQEMVQVESMVQAAHYEMSMTFYKAVGPPEAFYHQAIGFLHYAPPHDDRTLAVDLCLAALTGDGVYNLGQVVSLPLMKQLQQDAEYSWLVQLLQACAQGHVQDFHALSKQYAEQIQAQPALVHRAAAVLEKMTLLALVNMVFERPSHERTLGFAEIAERIGVNLDQVEYVVMRAFSVKLMEGSMDQVDQTVLVTWVLPRSLDTPQLKELASRFGEWAGKVGKTQEYMKEQTTGLA